MRLTPSPRLGDWLILAGIAIALATGLASLTSGQPDRAWVFAVHGVAGLLLVVLLAWKLRRVAPRLRPARWTRTTAVSVAAAAVAVGALSTGVFWTMGGDVEVLVWNALNLHIFLGLLLVPLVGLHLRRRFRFPRRVDFEGRRTALQTLTLVAGGALAWRLQRVAVSALRTAGAARRFTGSRERGRAPGNTFPATSWVADDPDPIDRNAWRLRVGGAVSRELALEYRELDAVDDRVRVTLDCTSGWYSTQTWSGVRVGRLLSIAGPTEEARWVRFTSLTGYRFSLPIEEAREALVATSVGGERLTHGHGFPARLVAPGRRGFQWVKWIESIDVHTDPDYGQWLAIFTSGFDIAGDPT